MKINLAAKNNDVKDNYPAGYCNICFKRVEDKSKQQKQHINNDGRVAQYYKSAFQPGKRYCLHRFAFKGFMTFYIPKNNSQ